MTGLIDSRQRRMTPASFRTIITRQIVFKFLWGAHAAGVPCSAARRTHRAVLLRRTATVHSAFETRPQSDDQADWNLAGRRIQCADRLRSTNADSRTGANPSRLPFL